ncbi:MULTISPECIES: hypothetical protein [Deinococcus]|jgi:hypothetical protein|uniref:FtsH-binding integral membrane protein n=2 Tax=Deinococcus soli (ex Cha et al. 2016) TaxID=1309411 RepID=A0ACC6KF45_9DEIO|nr:MULTISPECIES: hypothetical protein [Deinococcus]MDK2012070.1 hypothetical protein [Deinococcus sp. 43]MDR6217934.1 FtsH-binding integral membrane protein [Deinococcus soli (ex Cha et al. 2016)]MDR6328184.1 FtsH-binding integral membrane protein [Deinococcus soli (ex Cha et al. 2016)]MDR6751036.1 FtsH-binding integral membrane protein [Deinococcus soli (ex Cha et al. 2016)]
MSTPAPASVRRHLLLPFLAYFLMLASTSFIAGGIVHLGLGEHVPYYLALAVLGVVCFTAGNYLQEFVLRRAARPANLGRFLLVSFVLSVGIGMVTGGVQHFLDNPAYSAALIPAGLVLALLAFLAREGVPLSTRLPRVVGGTVAAAALLFAGLTTAARALGQPTQTGHAHGSADHSAATPETVPAAPVRTTAQETATSAAATQPVATPVTVPTHDEAPGDTHTDGHTDSGHDGH